MGNGTLNDFTFNETESRWIVYKNAYYIYTPDIDPSEHRKNTVLEG